MFPRSVLPPASVVLSWNDIEAALEYAAVEPDMWRAVARQLGDPDLSSLQIISILPSAVLRKAMEDAQVGARQRTAVEKGALSLALNAARTRFGLEPVSFLEDGTTTAVAHSPAHNLSGRPEAQGEDEPSHRPKSRSRGASSVA